MIYFPNLRYYDADFSFFYQNNTIFQQTQETEYYKAHLYNHGRLKQE